MELRKAPPPIAEQIKIIQTLLSAFTEAPITEGDKAYLVSKVWVDKALSLHGPAKVKTENGQVQLGPVDNSDIIGQVIKEPSGAIFTRLKPGADLDNFALFPEDAWKLVMEWYGMAEGQEPIVRTAIDSSETDEKNVLYEFHPPVFTVHRLWSELSPLPIEQSVKAKNPPAIVASRSRGARVQPFLKDLKNWAGIPLDRKVRLYEVRHPTPAAVPPVKETGSALTPPDSPGREAEQAADGPWPNLLVDLPSFAESRGKGGALKIQDQTDGKYNSNVTLSMKNLETDMTLVLDEMIDASYWVSTYKGQQTKPQKTISNRSGLSSKPSSVRSSPGPEGIMTRGRAGKTKKLGRSVGVVGLHNLGNTCYMNSALQCVRSVEELTKFFITDAYLDEINKTNLLGYNGRMAIAYGSLLRDIYQEGRGSVSPRDFKSTVGRCRSTFSGWGQQDSQEFLGFLLDALQEDLSRVKNKPFIEKPDSTDEMINDPEAIREMAAKVWDITRLRDDSVIADLFTGMYKSTLKCPECAKISITFDPFNTLTLPLPLETVWNKTVKFFPLNDVPVNIDVELPKHSSIEILKKYLSLRTGVPVERLMGVDEFRDRIFKVFDDSSDVSEEITQSDVPAFHELESAPTNWPSKAPQQRYRSMLDIEPAEPEDFNDPRMERMVVPVLHRRPSSYGRPEGISPPHFITLTREEASDYDAIQRKVLEKIATFSTWSKLNGDDEVDGADTDMVAASDADSSGDGKIAAKSVEGEEDMVDVTMKDASTPGQPAILKRFSKTKPRFADPTTPLSPSLQNLFELRYFGNGGDGAIATGYQSADNNRTLPSLKDRIPEASDKDEEGTTPESSNADASENENENENENDDEKQDSSNEEESKDESVQTRMAEESSEEDMPRRFDRGGRNQRNGGRKKFKGQRGFGKRANKRREKALRAGKANGLPRVSPQPMAPAVADGGPLIRLFEGIAVDWNDDAWEMVFGGNGNDSMAEGTRTFLNLESLQDPAIKINQRRRQTRKSRGITLDECLDEFERAEVLSEEDMWYCPRCKEHRRASKKFDLWKTPDYLVAHLKRFSSSGYRRDKLDVLVDFPIEELDLTSRVIEKEDGKSEVYDLIAVDDHYGGLGGGHYTAYAKNFVDGKWYNYNDSSVSLVSDPQSVITSAAYLLFYKRRASGHLGGPRFAAILDKYEKDSTEDESSDDTSTKADEEPPAYGGRTLRAREPSADSAPAFSAVRNESILAQAWNFDNLGSGAEQSGGAASDAAQFESSEDDGNARGIYEADTVMGGASGDIVPMTEGTEEAAEDEVTEIHVENAKSE